MPRNERLENVKRNMIAESNIMGCDEYRDIMIAISDIAADVVKKTLGPYGSTTVVEDGTEVYATKDGLHTVQNLRFGDSVYNILFNMMRKTCLNSAEKVGDGTSTALVIANHFLNVMLNYLDKNPEMRQNDLLKLINETKDEIIYRIETSPDLCHIDKNGDFSDIYKIAMISSNGDEKLASMIQAIYQETKNPDIYIEMDSYLDTTMEIDTGYRFDTRPISFKNFINTDDGGFVNSEPTCVFFFDHGVNFHEHKQIIEAIANYANTINKQVIIFAPSFDGVICKILSDSIDSLRRVGKISAIMISQLAYVTTQDKNTFEDLQLMTNCQIFDYGKVRAFQKLMTELTGKEFEHKTEDDVFGVDGYSYKTPTEIIKECAGIIPRIAVYKSFAIIQGFENIVNTLVWKNHLNEIKEEYDRTRKKAMNSSTSYQKEYLQANLRYIRLLGKMGRIHVGGATSQEKKYQYDVIEDTVFACRSAYNDGIIRGLNLTSIKILQCMKNECESELKALVIDFFYYAFTRTTLDVLLNKYDTHSAIKGSWECVDRDIKEKMFNCSSDNEVDILLQPEDIISTCTEHNLTFNMVTEQWEDKDHWTVLNPLRTDTEIIRSTVSLLSAIFSSNQFLSLNRSYNKFEVLQMKEEDANKRLAEESKIKANALLDVIINKIGELSREK